MRKSHLFGLVISIIFTYYSCTPEVIPTDVTSPDGKLKISLNLNSNAELFYKVEILENEEWKEVIEPSPMGIKRVDTEFTSGLSIVEVDEIKRIDDTYTMVIGGDTEYHSFANQRRFSLKNKDNKAWDIILRAYNDAAAFKYFFPGKDSLVYEVTGETTGFNLPIEGKAWMQPYDTVVWWAPAYEQFFLDGIDIGTTAPSNRNGWCFPMLFETGNRWIFISEAGLGPNYCGTHLEDQAPEGLYTIRFPEANEAYNYYPQNPTAKLPWAMPWRYIVISNDKEVILNSDHVHHLADLPKMNDINWIKPGVSSWSWWSENDSPRDYNAIKGFIDFASEMEWEYCLIDEGWHEMKGGTPRDLVPYARKKGVGLLLWYESGARVDYVAGDKQRQIMFDNDLREREFEKISSMGIKGVKIDFFQSDKQGVIKLYHDILEDAGNYKLLVNFHGCTMPRGWSKTYPHLLTMEAIKGAEAYMFSSDYPDYGAKHNTIIPFTRNVTGPMDYTPVALSDAKYPHSTSYAHELALAVVFESGILHFADNWKVYKELPELAIEYLKEVPVVWDNSKLISGYPGEDVIIARRTGKDWYIAGINGEKDSKEITLSLDFLPPGSFDFVLLKDGSGRNDLVTERMAITREDTLLIKMNANGGFVAKTGSLRPLN